MVRSRVAESFSEFFETWVSQLDQYLQQLINVSKKSGMCAKSVGGSPSSSDAVVSYEQEARALVSKVTQHYKEYYTKKWALAHEDVLAFYCPVWAAPLEVAFSWLTGWKPSAMFKIVDYMMRNPVPGPNLAELTQEQASKIEELRMRIRSQEKRMDGEMERQQVGLADRKMVELAKLASHLKIGDRDGDDTTTGRLEGLVDVALKGVLDGLEKVMKGADCVRLKTLKGVLDVLSPFQSLEFLAGGIIVQLKLRQYGKKLEANSTVSSADNNLSLF